MELILSSIDTELLGKIKRSWEQDQEIEKLIAELSQSPHSHPKYTWCQGLLKRKGKLVVGQDTKLRTNLIKLVHASPFGGHSGGEVTCKKLCGWFYWKSVEKAVRNWVRACEVYQRCKPILQTPAGTIRPLPIPGANMDLTY